MDVLGITKRMRPRSEGARILRSSINGAYNRKLVSPVHPELSISLLFHAVCFGDDLSLDALADLCEDDGVNVPRKRLETIVGDMQINWCNFTDEHKKEFLAYAKRHGILRGGK